MTINIADNSPRISYTVASGVTQTTFAVPFEFFDNTDLNVYINGTLQTITTTTLFQVVTVLLAVFLCLSLVALLGLVLLLPVI